MIAASEPLEFVPHGRTVLAKHPGQIYGKGHTNSSESSLMYKLTNFDIKDDSLLETKEKAEQEWWCIREVYYRNVKSVDDDPQLKDNKTDFNSESFRPPSRLKTEFNVSIKSELMSGVKKMETECVNSAGPSRVASANSSSNMSKKFNLPSASRSPKKPLNHKTDCFYEEELYVKDCTAVWSKGFISSPATKLHGPEQRETICCYTIENPIKHAAFCDFHVDINNTMLIDALNTQIGDVKKNIKVEDTTEHIQTDVISCIILLDSNCMRAFATDGREYITSVPFQVKKVWPIKYGLLLEKDATPVLQNSIIPLSLLKLNESNNSSFIKTKSNQFNMSAKLRAESVSGYDQDVPLPTCFSLSHPLDEVIPVIMKSQAQGLQYYNDGDTQIIFVSKNPSIILLYDWKLGVHSLWKIRKATRDECLVMCPNTTSTTAIFTQSCDYMGSLMHSNRSNVNLTGLGSPFHSKKGNTPMNSRSRLNSPMANLFHNQGLSPHGSIGQASSLSMMANTIPQTPPSLPLYPDICLEHIWTDNQVLRRDPIEKQSETKAFLHTDLVGHVYLCFKVKIAGVGRLQILRLQKSHSHGQSSKCNLIVGTMSTVLAKDAEVLNHLKMIALIDEFGNIILQSGNCFVGKVHVGGILARLIDSPYTKRSNFQSPFPRRSSLLPSRCNDTNFDDSSLHLLSPVPHTSSTNIESKESLGLSGLLDAAGSLVTLRFESGDEMYRISLPAISSCALVTRCHGALTAILPKDVTMQVLIKWYGVRNAPGTQDLTPEQEWSMFSNLMFTLIGYDVEKLQFGSADDQIDNNEVVSKKQRGSSDGTNEDWDYLLNSKMHKAMGNPLAALLNLTPVNIDSKLRGSHRNIDNDKPAQFNTNGLLFPYMMQILYAFHLLYEEIKLNVLLYNDLKPLSGFLYQLSRDLRLSGYVNHYWLDFPTEFAFEEEEYESQMSDAIISKVFEPPYFSKDPPHILSYLNLALRDVDIGYYPYLTDVNNTSRDIIEVLAIIGYGPSAGIQTLLRLDGMAASSTPRTRRDGAQQLDPYCQAIMLLAERGVRPRDVEQLPAGVALLVLGAAARCKAEPPADWPREAYQLVMRPDLALQRDIAHAINATDNYMETLALEVLEKETAYSLENSKLDDPAPSKQEDADTCTGMEHLNTKLLRLLYPRDHRMTEVCNLLQSSKPAVINLTQRPDVSDHDFIEEQEKYLYALSTRTLALPIGRGMATLRSSAWSSSAGVRAPRLCLWGRAAPRSGPLSPPAADLAPHALLWPGFHNGVASGLALVPLASPTIDATWLAYTKPRGTNELSTEHAGFLMALGLNGHLRDMPFMNIYEYLVKCHEMISIGLLLGLAATYRGTMDVQATKMLSIHLEPLLPPTSIELDIQQNILVAAILGVGLVYQGTAHAHYAQVLLNEIGKVPGPDMESCVEREGYALAAGLALGAVCVGAARGDRLPSALPPDLPRALRTLMLGGDHRPNTGTLKERYRSGNGLGTSTSTGAGSGVNVDVSGPGATVALGLLYLRSGAPAPAAWLRPPATPYHLDFVRPDLLMLRVIARGLILWDSIDAGGEWIEEQVPETIKPYCFVKPTEDNIDYEAMNQAYCNIVAGACFALGLRFAGSGCEEARDSALYYARLLVTLTGKALGELAGRSTLESCMCVCLLAAGMIMSGRGDVEVLRICRRLRARVPAPCAATGLPPLNHGAQMAIHCTIGLLFLGGGRATLSTSPTAVAALLAAFFPKFPTHSEDNRYHLQAFRHLYVLAVEPRLILPRDLDTGKLCYTYIQVIDLEGAVTEMKAPCLLPELDRLSAVKINDPRYWPIIFQRGRNWDQLEIFLKYTWCIDVKQRAGCLSHLDDPQGFLTLLAQTLTLDKVNVWSPTSENIELFTNDERVQNLVKRYLGKETSSGVCGDCLLMKKKRKGSRGELPMQQQCACRQLGREEREHARALGKLTYECVVRDALCALPVWTTFLKILATMKTEPTTYDVWQLKILQSLIETQSKRSVNDMKVDGEDLPNEPLISSEFTLAMKQKVGNMFDGWELKLTAYLRKYLGLPSSRKFNACEDSLKRILSAYLVYHDLPKGALKDCQSDDFAAVLGFAGNLSAEALSKIEALLR